MTLLSLCDQKPAAVSAEATVADAIRLMLEEHVGAVVVVDSENVVAGIFTERDVLNRIVGLALNEDLPIGDLMTRGPRTLSPDDRIADN